MMFVMNDLKFDTDTSVFVDDFLTGIAIGEERVSPSVKLYKSKAGRFFIVSEAKVNIPDVYTFERRVLS